MRASSSARRPACTRPARRPSSRSGSVRARMARNYFGTDGVRGIVGDSLMPELVERLGKAVALWSGRGRVFVGRDTRASGIELEDALARGIASAGGHGILAGVLPTPAVALLALQRTVTENALDLGIAFDGDGDRMLAVDELGNVVDGDHIIAILAPHLRVELVAVTVMSNLGLHRMLEERG